MRRRTRFTPLVLIALLAPVTACANQSADGPIEFWNPLTGDDGAFMQRLVDDYNATDPDIPVRSMPSPAADLYTRMYSVARAGSDLPDLTLVHGPRVTELARNELLTPIEPLMEYEATLSEENYLPAAWEQGQVDGDTWAIPLDLHGVITYYNVDLLEEYDAMDILDDEIITVDELMELEGRLDDGIYAVAGLFKPALVNNWQYNLGSSMANPDGSIDLTSDTYVQAMEALVDLEEAGLLEPEDTDSLQTFRSGRALFFPDGTWGATGHDGIDGLNYGVAHGVQLRADTPANFMESHVFTQMNDESRDPERDRAVAAFLEYVRTNSLVWAEAGQIVASREAYESPDYQDFAQSYFTRPENEEYLVTDNFEYAAYVNFWDTTNDIVYGRYTVEEGLRRMDAEVSARIELAEGA